MKKFIKTSAALLATLLMLTGCSASDEELIADTWYIEGNDGISLDLRIDGTGKMANEYGMCTWAIVNGNQLQITTYDGDVMTVNIEELSKGKLVISDDDETLTFINKPTSK